MARTRSYQTIDEVAAEIRAYVTAQFLLSSDDKPLRDDDLLFESGLIDSLGALTLIAQLERSFDIRIEDEELFPENFATLNRIAGYVARKVAARAVSAEEGCESR